MTNSTLIYKPHPLHQVDTAELARFILSLDNDVTEDIIEDSLENEFGIDLPLFHRLIEHLVPLIDVSTSPLTLAKYKGFSDRKTTFFVKQRIG